MRPLIGITANRHTFNSKLPGPALMGALLSDDYAQAVETAGGIPVILPFLETEEAIEATLARLDGLLLSGGDDVNPVLFGEEPRVGLGTVSNDRDFAEMALLHGAMEAGKPILGICRGIQVINVALGGTLYQDLPRQWTGVVQHSQKARRNHLSHLVHVDPASRLFHMLDNQSSLRTNSFHHQAIKDIAPDLIPVAWDDEGLVEAVEHASYPFLVGVQWHPENLWRTSPEFLGIFQAFINAVK